MKRWLRRLLRIRYYGPRLRLAHEALSVFLDQLLLAEAAASVAMDHRVTRATKQD
jgi:hypothetical protein